MALLYIFELWNIFSAIPQVILRESCSVNGCNSVVPMGGGELRSFLLYHLQTLCVTFVIQGSTVRIIGP